MSNDFEVGSIEYAKNVVGCDPFSQFLGIKVEEVKENYCKCSLVIEPYHLNGLERAHGSVLSAMCDQAMAVAANTHGKTALSLSISVNFVGAVFCDEELISEAVGVNIANKISHWRVEVKSNGKIVAFGDAAAYH